jgi:hypothetical protein
MDPFAGETTSVPAVGATAQQRKRAFVDPRRMWATAVRAMVNAGTMHARESLLLMALQRRAAGQAAQYIG